MVVAATDFYKALSDPLQAIQDLFEKKGDQANFSSLVASHFNDLFRENDSKAKITPLTRSLLQDAPLAESGPSVQVPKLVRWRCMIQDTSLGSELMPKRFKTGNGHWRNGLFGGASLEEDVDAEPDISSSQLSSLNTLFAVSLPGQSNWSRLANERLDSASSSMDLSINLDSLDLKEQHQLSCLVHDSIRSKLPTGREMGLLLKVYDEDLAESVRVAQAVDVIGILDQSTLPSAEWEESSAAAVLLPALHVVTMQKVESTPMEDDEDGQSDKEEEVREALISYLSQGLDGDRFTAQWLLLSLIAKIHTRSASHTLGPLSLNVSSFQGSTSSLSSLLSDVLPFVVDQSLDLDQLNDKSITFSPTSQADQAGLQAGRLQVVDGTVLLIDENAMQEGQLKDQGVENIRSLSTLLTNKKLAYRFPFSTLEMECDVNCIVFSHGKSFLPVDIQVPLRPSQQGTSSSSSSSHPFTVTDYRRFLTLMQARSSTSTSFTISKTISERIQNDFVECRSSAKKEKGSTAMESQEDLSRLIKVSRLLCLSRGEKQLTWQDWQAAKALDAERLLRLQ